MTKTMNLNKYYDGKTKVVSVNSILNALDEATAKGNIGPHQFSAAIFLSDLKKELEK